MNVTILFKFLKRELMQLTSHHLFDSFFSHVRYLVSHQLHLFLLSYSAYGRLLRQTFYYNQRLHLITTWKSLFNV